MKSQGNEAACRLLMKIEAKKVKEHYSYMLGILKKYQQSKLRRVASTYKRRHLMAVEKKLSWLRSQLLKTAFGSIKRSKKSEVLKEMQSLKQLFLVGCFEHFLKLRSLKSTFHQLMLLKCVHTPSHFDSARSDLYFQSVQAGEFSVLDSKRPEWLPTSLRSTSDTVKGHKKAKRHLAISVILLRLLRKPYSQLKLAGFKQIQLRASKVGTVHTASLQLEQLMQKGLQRQQATGLLSIRDRAHQLKARHLAYMTDVMGALFKKRALAPIFHYLKLEVPRIDRHNHRLIGLLCQSVLKLIYSSHKLCKQATLLVLKHHQEATKQSLNALAVKQNKVLTRDQPSRPLSKSRSGVHRNRVPERNIQRGSPGLASRRKSTARLAEEQKLQKEVSDCAFKLIPDSQTHRDQTSVPKATEGPVLKPLQQELIRSTRLLNALMAAEESLASRSKIRKSDVQHSKNSKVSPMVQLPKTEKNILHDFEFNKENHAPHSSLEKHKNTALSRNPGSKTGLAQPQFQPIGLQVPSNVPQRISADNKRSGRQDFFSFQKKTLDESHKPTNARDCKGPAPPITQFCADSGPRHNHSLEKRVSRVDCHGGPSSSEHRTQQPIAEAQTHIPTLPCRRRRSTGSSSRHSHAFQGNTSENTTTQPPDVPLNSAVACQQKMRKSTSLSRVSASQILAQEAGRPAEQWMEEDDCDVISHLTIVPIQPDW